MNSTTHSPIITTDLRLPDPREFGPTSRSPDLTKKARALRVRATPSHIEEIRDLLSAHLARGEDATIREALAACPDSVSYSYLYGFLAYQACNWATSHTGGAFEVYSLFGIPLTLHAREVDLATGWTPQDWGPASNAADLTTLRTILAKTGVSAGMDDLVILPHLVDPDDVAKLDFSALPLLARDMVNGIAEVAASGMLPHRPWEPFGDSAQCRVLVMASRSRATPRGLDDHSQPCDDALETWVERCFDVPPTGTMVSSAPERLLSLLTGKGLNMFNCARLAHMLGHRVRKGPDAGSPFISVDAASTGPCLGELRFRFGRASSVWTLHGRADWQEERATIGEFLPASLARFVRAQLSLDRDDEMDLTFRRG